MATASGDAAGYGDAAAVAGLPAAATEPPGPSRAGNPAGEGRERPGRDEMPVEEPRVPPATREPVEPPPEPVPPEAVVADRGRGGEPVLRILPLGSGMVLIGLGLGLAFVGLRVRRGQF